MLLKQFPDINAVRRLKNNAAQPADEWRNVVLNFECRETSRLNIDSPYSLFLNKRGHSHCSVNGRQYLVETDSFLFTQPGDVYGLTIDNLHKTEICNIHINRNFFNEVAHTVTATDAHLLDDPHNVKECTAPMFTQLYRKDAAINQITHKLTLADTYDNNIFEAVLSDLVVHLLQTGSDVNKSISKLPFTKASVRVDIYRRLALAKDYIYSNYCTAIDLHAICRETGMSKFHFLRVFKAYYGISPYQYLTHVRMEKAVSKLKSTSDSIVAISDSLGFEYPNSFIKAFHKTYHTSPLQYRKEKMSNFG